ncbi:hypothetical protein AMECASPLE_014946 [Ameca splendens]|uniref:Uncharacterized protein n=1 Tax=Ameca splendens TaxID=208324 RepID=A0ABV0ZBI6_9TELE
MLSFAFLSSHFSSDLEIIHLLLSGGSFTFLNAHKVEAVMTCFIYVDWNCSAVLTIVCFCSYSVTLYIYMSLRVLFLLRTCFLVMSVPEFNMMFSVFTVFLASVYYFTFVSYMKGHGEFLFSFASPRNTFCVHSQYFLRSYAIVFALSRNTLWDSFQTRQLQKLNKHTFLRFIEFYFEIGLKKRICYEACKGTWGDFFILRLQHFLHYHATQYLCVPSQKLCNSL